MPQEKKLKLLIATDTFYPQWTGISKSMYNLALSLSNDLNITVVTVSNTKGLKKSETIENIRILRSSYQFIISRSHYSFSILLNFIRISFFSDVILINSPSANILSFAIISKLFGKKLLIFHQGDLILPSVFGNRIIEKLFDILTISACFLADKIATFTKDYAVQSRILKRFPKKCYSLLLPVTLEKNSIPLTGIQKNKGEILFGFGGRFVEEKGFDVLFSAIPNIKKALPGAKFVFAGQRKMPYENFFSKTENLYQHLKNDIVFLGLLDDKKLYSFYKTIDFLIIPSRSDCFNMMQAEAMLAGTPCIASDIPGLSFMIKKTNFGVLFDSKNAHELYEKTVFAVANRKQIMLEYNNVLTVLERKTNVEKIRNFITK